MYPSAGEPELAVAIHCLQRPIVVYRQVSSTFAGPSDSSSMEKSLLQHRACQKCVFDTSAVLFTLRDCVRMGLCQGYNSSAPQMLIQPVWPGYIAIVSSLFKATPAPQVTSTLQCKVLTWLLPAGTDITLWREELREGFCLRR